MNTTSQISGAIACLLALAAVTLGAFGAHALKTHLTETGMIDVWKTAVDYQMWHSLAILLCSVLTKGGVKTIAVGLFTMGIVLFCGSLYWLALDGPKWLGPITPLGGLSFMLGWLCLAGIFIKCHPSE